MADSFESTHGGTGPGATRGCDTRGAETDGANSAPNGASTERSLDSSIAQHTTYSQTYSQTHSRNSSLGNWNDGLFEALDGLPSVTTASISADDLVAAQLEVAGGTSPLRVRVRARAGAGAGAEMDQRVSVTGRSRSVTPKKAGVRGVALRLASSCGRQGQGQGQAGGAMGVEVEVDSAPRTRYTGILKKLEFVSGGGVGGCRAETTERTRLMFTRLKETLEERGTPVGGRKVVERLKETQSQLHRTPVVGREREREGAVTATKKLMFSTSGTSGTTLGTSLGTMSSLEEHKGGSGSGPATVPTRYRGSARRVTFGRVSVDGGERRRDRDCTGVIEEREEREEKEEEKFSFQTMTFSAGSTPYSGKTYGANREDGRGLQQLITRDQLASALKKSLTFGEGADDLGEEEAQFSFGLDQVKPGRRGGPRERDQASTPDFSTFKTTSRRLLTPPSLSPSLLELHGRARRVSSCTCEDGHDADHADDADDAHHENDENENGNTPDDVGAGKLSTLSLPRLDVTEREANGAKHPKLLSPTEQGIRDSLKLERTRRLSSASKFNAGSTPGGSGASNEWTTPME